jgi:pimeloyl-ACP methyl ester carboxylesterase
MTSVHRFGEHEIDLARFEVRAGGDRVPVEPQVFDVLAYLAEHRDRVVTKDELLDAVWGDRFVSESALTSRIKAARQAVGDSGREQRVIRTVHGRGYQFVAPIDRDAVHRIPRTRYVRSDEHSIAYQVIGEGPADVVFIPGFVSNVELHWEHASFAHFFGRLAEAGRLITFDKRGTGLSERVATEHLPTLEERVDDLRAVLDDVGVERANVFGISEGAAMALLFSALHPDRVRRLALFGAFAWTHRLPDVNDRMVRDTRAAWGTGGVFEFLAPSTADDKSTRRYFSRLERHSATPDVGAGLVARANEIDVSDVLGSIQAPTVVLHRTGDPVVPVAHARALADAIPGARYVELPGEDHLVFIASDPVLDEVLAAFDEPVADPQDDRILATVLSASGLDAGVVQDHGGRLVGEVAYFDGPARAVRAAHALGHGGVHTAEVSPTGGGLGVELATQVAALAEPGEVWATRTVRDLVAGSGLVFEDRGEHPLDGVAEPWALYAVR